MKGFKDTTKTQMGHGYADEVPTRPATSKDVAAAKAVRIVTPSKPAAKPQPRVTDAMLRGEGEDKAPGERGAKRFAVGGVVPPVASGGMPAQGKPIMNANDARTAPPMQNGQRPMVAPRPAFNPQAQAYRDRLAAQEKSPLRYNLAGGPPTGRIPYQVVDKASSPVAQPIRSTGKPNAPTLPPVASAAYKRGGKVVEKGGKEVYASKAAMKKHEAKETKAQERAEHKQEGGELLAGRAQSLRDMVGKPAARAGYAQGGKPKSKWS